MHWSLEQCEYPRAYAGIQCVVHPTICHVYTLQIVAWVNLAYAEHTTWSSSRFTDDSDLWQDMEVQWLRTSYLDLEKVGKAYQMAVELHGAETRDQNEQLVMPPSSRSIATQIYLIEQPKRQFLASNFTLPGTISQKSFHELQSSLQIPCTAERSRATTRCETELDRVVSLVDRY